MIIDILFILGLLLVALSYPAYLIWYNSSGVEPRKPNMVHLFWPLPVIMVIFIVVFENESKWRWIDTRNERIAACETGNTSEPCRVIAEDFQYGVTARCSGWSAAYGGSPTSRPCTLLEPNSTKSLYFMNIACQRGDQTACFLSYSWATAYKDVQISKLEHFCEDGVGLACEHIYVRIKDDPNYSPDNKRALLNTGCEDSQGFSCVTLLQIDMLSHLQSLGDEDLSNLRRLNGVEELISLTLTIRKVGEEYPDYAYHHSELVKAYGQFDLGKINILNIAAVRQLANEVYAKVAAVEIPRLTR